MLYIGVDLGTSAVKLLLMNAEGKIESVVSKEYPSSGLVGTETGRLVECSSRRLKGTDCEL